jgi:hypothetical protein
MTKDDAIKHFGSVTKLSRALGIKQPSISLWGDYPPPLRQVQIEALTGGVLRAEEGILPAMDVTLREPYRRVNRRNGVSPTPTDKSVT